jgi:MFS superfamily sulfate permease-like transporter
VNRGEVLVYGVTLACIVSINLLYGVLIGIALAAGRLLLKFANVNIRLESDPKAMRTEMHIEGAATFVLLPRLAVALEEVPRGHELHVHLDNMTYIDHACIDLLANWEKSRGEDRQVLFVEWEELMSRYRKGPSVRPAGEVEGGEVIPGEVVPAP